VIDSALVLLFPYLAYTIAESAKLSGIVAVLFCGMVMAGDSGGSDDRGAGCGVQGVECRVRGAVCGV
jgi:NhaP-type Na+/H+ or K+/H+ antiporter